MDALNDRLTEAEKELVCREFNKCLFTTEDILKELQSSPSLSSTPFLARPAHVCVEACVCKATVLLQVQALYELGQTEKVRLLLENCFGTVGNWSFDVFFVWYDNHQCAAFRHVALSQNCSVVDQNRQSKFCFHRRDVRFFSSRRPLATDGSVVRNSWDKRW